VRGSLGTLAEVKRLIINADDFGLTDGINQSVRELHAAGALTSATLMANAEKTAAAAKAGDALSSLGIGCHLVLVDGTPILPAAEIPTLIDHSESGPARFRATLGGFVADLVRGRIREAEIEAEATAQLHRLQHAGVKLTHVDSHKHTHMFPRVLRPVLRAALRASIRAIRNPFEPDWSLRATPNSGGLRQMQIRILRSQRNYFLKATRQAGVATTDGAIGVLATGTLDTETLRLMFAAMPNGEWELVCHPGYHDSALDAQQTRLLHSREVERAALLAAVPEAVAKDPELTLIHFGQLRAGSVPGGTGQQN
jgi:predicted glycoside hydrolase/deacetylase ChbG (UPF0249 family)